MTIDRDKPASDLTDEAGAPDDEIEVTPVMIDAGERAFYGRQSREDLDDVLPDVFRAMLRASRSA
jgi:hypothetical protein